VIILQAVPDEHGYVQDIRRMEANLSTVQEKDCLLGISIENSVSTVVFKQSRDGFNQ
jgi:hypothetical protein